MVNFLYILSAFLFTGAFLGAKCGNSEAFFWGIGSSIICMVIARFLKVLEEIRDRLPTPTLHVPEAMEPKFQEKTIA
jgi:hypothetical protein